MKSISIKTGLLLAVLLFSIASFAKQGTRMSVDQRATIQMQKVNSVCALTPQQQIQVKQLFVTNFINRAAFEASKGKDKVTRKAAKKAIKQNIIPLSSVLTPSQLTKWKARK